MPKFILELIQHFLKLHGKDIYVLLETKIASLFKKRLAGKTVVVLGPKQTGKSSLICYIEEGTPYKVVDGKIQMPNPTCGAVIVSATFKLPEGGKIHIPKDVAGDPDLRSQWEALLNEWHPSGVIYMLDGSRGEDALRIDIEELSHDVLTHYDSGFNSTVSLHIFLNFTDRWCTTPGVGNRKIAFVQELLSQVRLKHPNLDHVRMDVSATQLSPHLTAWPETRRAIFHFCDDLA